jgi:homoserine trans-succinylase
MKNMFNTSEEKIIFFIQFVKEKKKIQGVERSKLSDKKRYLNHGISDKFPCLFSSFKCVQHNPIKYEKVHLLEISSSSLGMMTQVRRKLANISCISTSFKINQN